MPSIFATQTRSGRDKSFQLLFGDTMKVKAKSVFLWPAFMCFLSLVETFLHEYLKMAKVSCHTNQNIRRARNDSPIYFSTLGPNLLYNTSVYRCTPHTAQYLQVTRSPLSYLRASGVRGEVCWQRIAAQPNLVLSRQGQPLPFLLSPFAPVKFYRQSQIRIQLCHVAVCLWSSGMWRRRAS